MGAATIPVSVIDDVTGNELHFEYRGAIRLPPDYQLQDNKNYEGWLIEMDLFPGATYIVIGRELFRVKPGSFTFPGACKCPKH